MNSNLTIVAFLQNKILTFVLFILLAAIGSVVRWTLQNSRKWGKSSGTFIANIIASFLLGVLLGGSPSGEEVTIIGSGFLGSFSTFSTVMMEVSDELEKEKRVLASTYLIASIITGVAAAFLGLEVGGR
ncbi:MAG: CrcB family protein [Actinomycetota bacterium]|nr:CrcB family protein [Actinomycetota bacterium]